MTENQTRTGEYRRRLRACFEEVEEACDRAMAILAENGLEEDSFQVHLLLREALNNAVLHGSRMDPEKHVNFMFLLDNTGITFEVEDEGPGFDWRSRPKETPDVLATSGRGMNIMNAYAQTVEYNDKGNRVTVRMKL